MSTVRVPLANNPNAVNSPRRAAVASKRGRVQCDDDVSPPKKRQNLGSFRRAQKISINEPEGKVFTERRNNAPQNAFQRQLLKAREARETLTTQAVVEANNNDSAVGPSKEQIQNWRRHYRRVFPQFVFYFDGLPAEVALKTKRILHGLGAVRSRFVRAHLSSRLTVFSVMSNSFLKMSPMLSPYGRFPPLSRRHYRRPRNPLSIPQP